MIGQINKYCFFPNSVYLCITFFSSFDRYSRSWPRFFNKFFLHRNQAKGDQALFGAQDKKITSQTQSK